MPCLTLGASGVAVIIRFLISSITEVLGPTSSVRRTPRAERARVIRRHVMKVALLPVVNVVAMHFGSLLGGAVVTEPSSAYPVWAG